MAGNYFPVRTGYTTMTRCFTLCFSAYDRKTTCRTQMYLKRLSTAWFSAILRQHLLGHKVICLLTSKDTNTAGLISVSWDLNFELLNTVISTGGERVSSHINDPLSLGDFREEIFTVYATELESFTSSFR